MARQPITEPLLQIANTEALPSLPEELVESPALIGSESYEWNAIPDLDKFFRNLYEYHKDKGFVTMLTSRILNQILTLAFLIVFAAVLLLYINWHALHSECLMKGTCDILQVAIYSHPLRHSSLGWSVFCITFLSIFSLYWCWTVGDFLTRCVDLFDTAHFCNHKLGISERQIRTITWPEFVQRVVEVQKTTRLCIQRDLSEHDIVSRIMRRDNFLIGMLNKGVLALHVPVPGLRHHFMLTKTLEWSLNRCIFDHMFDSKSFCVKEEFKNNPEALKKRFRFEAVLMLILSPFVLIFLLIYFFLRNAEKLYHHPSSVGARRWSLLAKWRMREFNELEHYIQHRLNASQKAAENYISQFPSPVLSHVARFVSFVTGSFMALLLFVTLVDEKLLERPLMGRNLVWWVATLGIVLAITRTFIIEHGTALDPEMAMMEVVTHTHYLPRHWRGRAHSHEVQEQFQGMFQFKVLLFLEEMASIVLTPFVMFFSMPKCAGAIVQFVQDFTVHVDGVGHICSLATFDFQKHGNSKYGSPFNCPKSQQSRQGKMEKSFLNFLSTYPSWEPCERAKAMLHKVVSNAKVPPQGYPPASSMHDPYAMMMMSMNGIGGRYIQVGGMSTTADNTYLHHVSPQPSLFASAELTTPASCLLSSPGLDAEERVAASHAMLQNHYQEKERELQQQRQEFQQRRQASSQRRQQHSTPTPLHTSGSSPTVPPPRDTSRVLSRPHTPRTTPAQEPKEHELQSMQHTPSSSTTSGAARVPSPPAGQPALRSRPPHVHLLPSLGLSSSDVPGGRPVVHVANIPGRKYPPREFRPTNEGVVAGGGPQTGVALAGHAAGRWGSASSMSHQQHIGSSSSSIHSAADHTFRSNRSRSVQSSFGGPLHTSAPFFPLSASSDSPHSGPPVVPMELTSSGSNSLGMRDSAHRGRGAASSGATSSGPVGPRTGPMGLPPPAQNRQRETSGSRLANSGPGWESTGQLSGLGFTHLQEWHGAGSSRHETPGGVTRSGQQSLWLPEGAELQEFDFWHDAHMAGSRVSSGYGADMLESLSDTRSGGGQREMTTLGTPPPDLDDFL